MKKAKIVVVFTLVLSFVFGAGGCNLFNSTKDVQPEAVMPQDMSAVMVFDHSNAGQMKLLKEILGRIPSVGLVDMAISEYEENKDLINGGWKIAAGFKLPEGKKMEELLKNPNISFDETGIEIYIAAKFEMADKVQELLNKLVKTDPDEITFVGTEKNPVWKLMKVGDGSVLIVRYGDLYFTATTSAQEKAVLDRIKSEDGFDKNPEYIANMKALGAENVGYVFVNAKSSIEILGKIFSESGVNLPMGALELVGNVWAVCSLNDTGVKVVSKAYLSGDKALLDKYVPSYSVDLIKTIPSKGVFLYGEMPSFAVSLEGLADLAVMGVKQEFSPEGGKISRIAEDSKTDSQSGSSAGYSMVLDQLAGISGLKSEDIGKIFDNPYAFSISDSGGNLVPSAALYLKIDRESLENAKTLVASTSTYVDQIFDKMDQELKRAGLDGILKKEVKTVNGAALQKIYVDWSALSADRLSELNSMGGMDVSTMKLEFYYGVLSDGVLVFALYPDFTDEYGKDPIADAGYYKEMLTEVGDLYGDSVSFFRMAPVLDFANRYFELYKKTGLAVEGDDINFQYEMYSKFASAFKYVFMSGIRNDDGMMSSTILAIQKAEFSPELKKKLEADKEAKEKAAKAVEKAAQEAGGGGL
ncbi:MAG: hypothetical protein WC285_05360 [Candidatus Gracilibacteria bacterium]|jgi:hypothetical protein